MNFKRGQSKVFYESDIWDPGSRYPDPERSNMEGRTSFRASPARTVMTEDVDNFTDFHKLGEDPFPDPVLAKPLPLLSHHPGHPR